MSTAAIIAATQARLSAVLTAAGEVSFVVVLGVPKVVTTDTVVYLWDDGYADEQKAGPGWVRRQHNIPIHLMVLSTGDDDAAEQRLMALSDLIGNAFYTDRKLGGVCGTTELHQSDGGATRLAQTQPYIVYQNGEYRHRWWSLTAAEDLVFAFQ